MRLIATLILGLLIAGEAVAQTGRETGRETSSGWETLHEVETRQGVVAAIKARAPWESGATGGKYRMPPGLGVLTSWQVMRNGDIQIRGPGYYDDNGRYQIGLHVIEGTNAKPFIPKSYPDIIIEDGDGNVIGKGYYSR